MYYVVFDELLKEKGHALLIIMSKDHILIQLGDHLIEVKYKIIKFANWEV